jgi:predicted P-loop ATPase
VGEQGKFKSSFLRLLATNDLWCHDNFNSLEGDKAFEKLRGKWIVELAELQATKRAKDVESIKAFITSTTDTYRSPYARRSEDHPRMCVLAGTSNPVDFLTDRTGNRRFLPITCSLHETINPFDDVEASRAEILQAWGEIMDEYMRAGGHIPLILTKEQTETAKRIQEGYLEEDPDVGIIQAWLEDHEAVDRVCAVQLWKEALNREFERYTRKDINAIHEIMKNNISGWKPVGKIRCDKYGVQRAYERIQPEIILEDWEESDETLPFND